MFKRYSTSSPCHAVLYQEEMQLIGPSKSHSMTRQGSPYVMLEDQNLASVEHKFLPKTLINDDVGSLPNDTVSKHVIQPASNRSKGMWSPYANTQYHGMAAAKVASIHANVAVGNTELQFFTDSLEFTSLYRICADIGKVVLSWHELE